ncbi:MAG: hypothetical protein ACK42Z_01935 [Candidatus Kapaibacteriota bacterium]
MSISKPKALYITLKVFDVLEDEIATLVNGKMPAGDNTVLFFFKGGLPECV